VPFEKFEKIGFARAGVERLSATDVDLEARRN
jgi:hypothetical protein